MPISASCSLTMKRKSDPDTTSGGAKPAAAKRRAEAWNRLSVPDRAENCLGKLLRDRGQSRVPEPPLNKTGWSVCVIELVSLVILSAIQHRLQRPCERRKTRFTKGLAARIPLIKSTGSKNKTRSTDRPLHLQSDPLDEPYRTGVHDPDTLPDCTPKPVSPARKTPYIQPQTTRAEQYPHADRLPPWRTLHR